MSTCCCCSFCLSLFFRTLNLQLGFVEFSECVARCASCCCCCCCHLPFHFNELTTTTRRIRNVRANNRPFQTRSCCCCCYCFCSCIFIQLPQRVFHLATLLHNLIGSCTCSRSIGSIRRSIVNDSAALCASLSFATSQGIGGGGW